MQQRQHGHQQSLSPAGQLDRQGARGKGQAFKHRRILAGATPCFGIIANFHDTPVEKADRNVRNTAQTGGFWWQSDWHRTCIIKIQATNRRIEMPRVQASRRKQAGFTLVEIAIVLVIIGLLLGGVLKGQELINSAKVKNMANDFRNIPVFVYAYQDKFKRLPGDDSAAITNVNAPAGHNGNGNGVIEGKWNETNPAAAIPTNESVLFWEHVRLANLAAGSTDFSDTAAATASLPTNADGGKIGISGVKPITSMIGGSYYVCSDSIDGKFARQLDLTIDDGVSDKGSVQGVAQVGGSTKADGATTAAASYVDGTRYTVCMTY
jgi:prepilin-type N-terminal cleavage/methylation domain-containing protein